MAGMVGVMAVASVSFVIDIPAVDGVIHRLVLKGFMIRMMLVPFLMLLMVGMRLLSIHRLSLLREM
jgi:hypothetical protein